MASGRPERRAGITEVGIFSPARVAALRRYALDEPITVHAGQELRLEYDKGTGNLLRAGVVERGATEPRQWVELHPRP